MSKHKKPTVILVDALNLLYRFFYGAPLKVFSPANISVGALRVFINTLISIKNTNPDYIAVCFDSTEKSQEKRVIFSDYKSNRDAMPQELALQVDMAKKATSVLGCNPIEKPGIEADDIIARISIDMQDSCSIHIFSNDKDFFQIINENTTVIRKTGEKTTDYMDKEGVFEKLGCYPDRVLDFLSISGDQSDNIPGIYGIGPKGALEIINKFDNIEDALNNKHLLSKRVASKLNDESIKSYRISRQLIDLHNNFSPSIHKQLIVNKPIYHEEAQSFLDSVGLGSTLLKLYGTTAKTTSEHSDIFSKSMSAEDFLLLKIKNLEVFVLYDVIDNSCSINTKITNLHFSLRDNKSNVFHTIPISHETIEHILTAKKLYIFNIKSFMHGASKHNVTINISQSIKIFDCAIALYLLEPNGMYFTQKNLLLLPSVKIDANNIPSPDTYISEIDSLEDKIQSHSLSYVMNDVDTPFSWVAFEMEKNGLFFDKECLLSLRETLSNELIPVEAEIFNIAQETFNIASTKQLSYILYEKLELKAVTQTRQTNIQTLEKIKDTTGIIKLIVRWRNIKKNISTYIDGIIKHIHPETKRVHPEFNIFGTSTGRISCKNPNLQNIPTTSKGSIRSCITPQCSGLSLTSFDYSQMEIKVLAAMSKEPVLELAFEAKEDIHINTASKIFKKNKNLINNQERNSAKTINFGIMYGQGARSLANSLKISFLEAQQLIDEYFKSLPKVELFIQDCISHAKDFGFSITASGRRRPIPEIYDFNFLIKQFGKRAAINSTIQGTAADIIKLSTVRLYRYLKDHDENIKIILQVHDEIVLESRPLSEKYIKNILKILEKCEILNANLNVTFCDGNTLK